LVTPSPPIVDTTNLTRAIDAATEKGVVISQTAHAIVHDRLASDPAIWIVQENRQALKFWHDEIKLLRVGLSEPLRSAQSG